MVHTLGFISIKGREVTISLSLSFQADGTSGTVMRFPELIPQQEIPEHPSLRPVRKKKMQMCEYGITVQVNKYVDARFSKKGLDQSTLINTVKTKTYLQKEAAGINRQEQILPRM